MNASGFSGVCFWPRLTVCVCLSPQIHRSLPLPPQLPSFLFPVSCATCLCLVLLQTFKQIEAEKSEYKWQIKQPSKDPLGLLEKQTAIYW
jgi:hypothetical protein